MDGLMIRSLASVLAIGMALWGPMPLALAQVEVTSEVREACQQFEPAIRDIALNEVVPKLEEASRPDASPEAKAEAKVVETTAAAIRETTETTKKALENPEAMAKNAVEALAKSGVPTEVATKVEQQMKDAFAKARETLGKGGTLDDASKHFESAKSAMAECTRYLGGKDFKEVFAAAGPAGLDRGELHSMEFMGAVMDPKARDTIEAAMKAHFEGSVRDTMLRNEALGPPMEAMRTAMEQMSACGINPREIMEGAFRGGVDTARFSSDEHFKEMTTAMTPEQAKQAEVYRDAMMKGDFATIEALHQADAAKAGVEAMEKYGMTPEMVAREITMAGAMETMYHEAITSPTSDAPRTETSGYSVTSYETKYADGHALCPPGKTHVEGQPDGTPGHCI